MNHMSEVAKMLGVELGEIFEINRLGSSQFRFKENCFQYFNGKMWVSDLQTQSIFHSLFTGQYTIKRNPWKPKDEEAYWYIDEHGNAWTMTWENEYLSNHTNYYKLGNCYRTKEEALANRDKWVAFYESDEVLEVQL